MINLTIISITTYYHTFNGVIIQSILKIVGVTAIESPKAIKNSIFKISTYHPRFYILTILNHKPRQ